MIYHILAKLYGLILEKKLRLWLENHGKRAKGQDGFQRHHSTINPLVTLRVIVEEFGNSKFNIFCFFVDFRKAFEIVPRDKLWKILDEIMIPPEFKIIVIRLYETVVSKFNTNKGWSKDIKCNIGVKKWCPLSPSLFGIYIDKLQEYLEIAGCKGTKLVGIIFALLLHAGDIVLLAKSHKDLENKLKTLHEYFSKMGMMVNIDKTKIMIIKFKKITHGNFFYDNNLLDQVSSYKYLVIDIPYQLNSNYNIEKRIIGGWKTYYELEKSCKVAIP